MQERVYPMLWNFLAGEFNQDWHDWNPTWQAVVASFIEVVGQDDLAQLRYELEIVSRLSELELTEIFREYCCFYIPTGTYSEWIDSVIGMIREKEKGSGLSSAV